MSSYEEVTAILAQCRISHFRQAFLDNECDDSFLDIVEDGDLRELGLPLGPRVRLLKAVADRNAARARAPAVTPTRTFAPPPPPPQGSAQVAVPPPPPPAAPASPRNEDNLCELCADREQDCKIAGCGHRFCRVCVDLWRRESVRKAQQNTMCPNCRAPFTEVVDLGTGRAAAAAPPRPAWGAAPPPPPVSLAATAAEEEARRRREAEAREAAERERAAAARERAAAEARRREETARGHRVAAEDAAAVATFYATREAAQWALRAGTGKTAAEVRAEARERARAAMWGAGATMAAVTAYVEAYAAAATGAFVHAEAEALSKDRDDAAAAVISAFIGEVVAATRRDAASAALAEVAEEGPKAPDPKAAAWKPFEEFAAEVVAVIDAAGGELLAKNLPAAYEAKFGRPLDFKALGFASMSALAPRIPGVALRDGHDPERTVLMTGATAAGKTLVEVERRILELIDEGAGGKILLSGLPHAYKSRYAGQELDTKAVGFKSLLSLMESLRGVNVFSMPGRDGVHYICRALAPVRILQRPAAAPAPVALSGDAGEFQPSSAAPAPAAAPRRLSGDAGEFRPASPAPSAPAYAQPPIPPPPQGFVPVFAPPPPLFVPGVPVMQGMVLMPPLHGAPGFIPLVPGAPPAPGGMYYGTHQPPPPVAAAPAPAPADAIAPQAALDAARNAP
jgi:hypothetical protein